MQTETVVERLASAVRAEMARKRITQGGLAAALGVSPAAVSRRLNGVVEFSVSELETVAHLVGLTAEALLATARTSS